MRTLMTLLTLGAGGVSYAYLQLPAAVGEPYVTDGTASPKLDWKYINAAKTEGERVPVKQLVSRIHERTRSALEEFANRHGNHSDAPVDDAFQRLRQVTQSAMQAVSDSNQTTAKELGRAKLSRTAVPNLDDLQRTAFEPANEIADQSRPVVTVAQNNADQDDGKTSTQSVEKTNSNDSVGMKSTKADEIQQPKSQTEDVVTAIPKDAVSRRKIKSVSERITKPIESNWKSVGKTTQGRPMHTMQLGEAGTRTLVIAGINGDDTTAVRWLEMLIDDLKHHGELLNTNEVLFFRAGNPDGLVRNQRANSRGVLLNRNFPSRRFRRPVDGQPLATPASEIETRVILETLYSFRPRRVIHLTATTGRSQVLYNRSAKPLVLEFARATKLTSRLFDPEQSPGSIEDFADGTLEAAVVSIRLSVEDDWQNAWKKVQQRVMEVVVGRTVNPANDGQTDSLSDDPDRSLLPFDDSEPPPRVPRHKGYEELPPLPKIDAAAMKAK